MGYNTDFSGEFEIEPALTPEHIEFLLEIHRANKNLSDEPPNGWCQWVPSEDGTVLCWDGGEKFYDYIEWLKCLLNQFFIPNGYTLNGEVEWDGDGSDDRGMIAIDNNNKLKIFDDVSRYVERGTDGKQKVLVVLEGGVIQNILGPKDVQVVVRDYDVEGLDLSDYVDKGQLVRVDGQLATQVVWEDLEDLETLDDAVPVDNKESGT